MYFLAFFAGTFRAITHTLSYPINALLRHQVQ
jgi:hypothetical protein